jgi:hypothetical protein
MAIFRVSRCLWIVLVSVFLLGATAHGGGPPLDLDGSQWGFEQTLATFKAKAKGLGKVKMTGVQGIEVTLLPGSAWLANIDGTLTLQGTYTRESATAKRLILTLHAASTETLQDLYAQQVEAAAAAEGIPLDVDVTLVKEQTTVKIRLRAKTGTATAKLKMKLKFTAAIPTIFGGGGTGKIISKLRGVSAPIPLTDVTGP